MKKVNILGVLILLSSISAFIYSCTKDKIAPAEDNTIVSFRNDIYPVFAGSGCSNTGCHADVFSPPLMFSLDSCYTSLLRDTSYNIDGYRYVDTTNAQDSYLYIKLVSSNPPYGDRMPVGGPYLSSEFTAKVLRWIEQGAPDN
jgi:hypothetical protein